MVAVAVDLDADPLLVTTTTVRCHAAAAAAAADPAPRLLGLIIVDVDDTHMTLAELVPPTLVPADGGSVDQVARNDASTVTDMAPVAATFVRVHSCAYAS